MEKASLKSLKVAERRHVENIFYDDFKTKMTHNRQIKLGIGHAMMHLKGLSQWNVTIYCLLGVLMEKASLKPSKVAERRPFVNMYCDGYNTKVKLNLTV